MYVFIAECFFGHIQIIIGVNQFLTDLQPRCCLFLSTLYKYYSNITDRQMILVAYSLRRYAEFSAQSKLSTLMILASQSFGDTLLQPLYTSDFTSHSSTLNPRPCSPFSFLPIHPKPTRPKRNFP